MTSLMTFDVLEWTLVPNVDRVMKVSSIGENRTTKRCEYVRTIPRGGSLKANRSYARSLWLQISNRMPYIDKISRAYEKKYKSLARESFDQLKRSNDARLQDIVRQGRERFPDQNRSPDDYSAYWHIYSTSIFELFRLRTTLQLMLFGFRKEHRWIESTLKNLDKASQSRFFAHRFLLFRDFAKFSYSQETKYVADHFR